MARRSEWRSRRPRGATQARQDLPLVEAEEPLLVRPGFSNVDLVEPRLAELLNGGDVPLGIGAADHGVGHVLLAPRRHRLLEVTGERQLDAQLTLQPGVGPPLMG